jgi:hypothetical protein
MGGPADWGRRRPDFFVGFLSASGGRIGQPYPRADRTFFGRSARYGERPRKSGGHCLPPGLPPGLDQPGKLVGQVPEQTDQPICLLCRHWGDCLSHVTPLSAALWRILERYWPGGCVSMPAEVPPLAGSRAPIRGAPLRDQDLKFAKRVGRWIPARFQGQADGFSSTFAAAAMAAWERSEASSHA